MWHHWLDFSYLPAFLQGEVAHWIASTWDILAWLSLSNSLPSQQEGRKGLKGVKDEGHRGVNRLQGGNIQLPRANLIYMHPLRRLWMELVHDSSATLGNSTGLFFQIFFFFFWSCNLWIPKCFLNSQLWEQLCRNPQISHSKFLWEIRKTCLVYFNTLLYHAAKHSKKLNSRKICRYDSTVDWFQSKSITKIKRLE